MITKEKDVTPLISKWFSGVVKESCPFEIKHTRGKDTFKMRELAQHQRDYLLACTTKKGLTYKLPDMNVNYQPFDCLHYKNSEAFVVIVYPQFMVAIEIRDILKIETPSLNAKEAMAISHFSCYN